MTIKDQKIYIKFDLEISNENSWEDYHKEFKSDNSIIGRTKQVAEYILQRVLKAGHETMFLGSILLKGARRLGGMLSDFHTFSDIAAKPLQILGLTLLTFTGAFAVGAGSACAALAVESIKALHAPVLKHVNSWGGLGLGLNPGKMETSQDYSSAFSRD